MHLKISIVLLFLGSIWNNLPAQSHDMASIKKGMIKMAIYYPAGEGKTFDMDYYVDKHMAMAAELMGDSLKAMVIDKSLSGATPETDPPYVAVGYFYFDSMTAFQEAMGPISPKLREDVPNYTNIQPVIQISEVVTAE